MISAKPVVLLAMLTLVGLAPGQDLTFDEIRQRLAQGKPVWNLSWKLDDDGMLFMSPDTMISSS